MLFGMWHPHFPTRSGTMPLAVEAQSPDHHQGIPSAKILSFFCQSVLKIELSTKLHYILKPHIFVFFLFYR